MFPYVILKCHNNITKFLTSNNVAHFVKHCLSDTTAYRHEPFHFEDFDKRLMITYYSYKIVELLSYFSTYVV